MEGAGVMTAWAMLLSVVTARFSELLSKERDRCRGCVDLGTIWRMVVNIWRRGIDYILDNLLLSALSCYKCPCSKKR
jgi:hypothetical protein